MRNLIFCLISGILLTSCSQNIDVSAEIGEIDTLLERVSKAELVYTTEIAHDELNWRLDSLKICMNLLEKNYAESMTDEDAVKFDEFYNTKKIIHKYKSRASQILKEIERTRTQLTNFKSALSQKATHDKNGKEIDQEYINRQMQREREAAEYLIQSISELNERSTRFIQENEEKLQAILPYLE